LISIGQLLDEVTILRSTLRVVVHVKATEVATNKKLYQKEIKIQSLNFGSFLAIISRTSCAEMRSIDEKSYSTRKRNPRFLPGADGGPHLAL
jgi:hypothetical protein